MNSEQQYIDIFTGCREMLDSHSAGAMNALRDKAFEDFTRQGFLRRKWNAINIRTCRRPLRRTTG